jgi:TolB-like protein
MKIFFIFFLRTCSLSFAEDKPKVNVFEFSSNFTDKDKSDEELKERLQNKIMDRLRRSPNIGKVEFISRERAAMIGRATTLGRKEEYYKEMGIRYVIEGKMENIKEEKLRIRIDLLDMKIKEEDKGKFRRERTLKKEMKTMEYWFDKVSKNIYSVIEGVEIKEIVFTYCFKTLGNGGKEENENVREVKLGMPKKLTTRLKDKLSQNYILETFRKKGDIIDECEKKEGYGPDINVYEYILLGEIEPHQETDEYEVTVEILITDKRGRKTLVEGFREKYSPVFFEKLAERIMNEWKRKMNEGRNK